MMNKNEIIKSGFYEVVLENTIPSKDWIYHWFIIKNLFKYLGFKLNALNDNYPQYLNIVGNHKGYLIEKKLESKYDNILLNKFSGYWDYIDKNKKIDINKELSNYFKKYFNTNNINIQNISINNKFMDYSDEKCEEQPLGFYTIYLNKNISPENWTYHWFIIKNMFKKLNFNLIELNDNDPEYRNIIQDKLSKQDLFSPRPYKNPLLTKSMYLNCFEGFCSVYTNKKIDINKDNIKKYENFRDKKIDELIFYLNKYYKLNKINIKNIDIRKDKINFF